MYAHFVIHVCYFIFIWYKQKQITEITSFIFYWHYWHYIYIYIWLINIMLVMYHNGAVLTLMLMLCQRLKDQYVENWGAFLENSSKWQYYRKYKTNFCQDYLNIFSIVNDNLHVYVSNYVVLEQVHILKRAYLLVLLEIVVYANYVFNRTALF